VGGRFEKCPNKKENSNLGYSKKGEKNPKAQEGRGEFVG